MRTVIPAAIFALLLAASCLPLEAQTTPPIFLYFLEGGGAGMVHVFSVNSSTGAITEDLGSPYAAGVNPEYLVVDPTGRFVYVANEESEDVTAFSVDASTGALTEMPGAPFSIGAAPAALGIDPSGRFLYVFATSTVDGVEKESLYEYTIDSVAGILSPASSSPTIWENGPPNLIVSMAFDPVGNYLYLGQVKSGNLGAPTLVCSLNFTNGTLTKIGSVQPAEDGEAQHLAISPTGNFLYSVNSAFNQANVFTIGSEGASLTEVSGSPYSVPNFPSSLAVNPSGDFLYIANQNQSYQTDYSPSQYDGSITVFAVNSATGALTPLSGSPYAAGINPLSVVVDPTGSFVYSTATTYTSGYTGFAQILGFSINPSSGALTPFSGPPWTDPNTSNGNQLAISYGPATAPNPTPMISSLSPPSTIATAVAFTLQVNGSNFVPGSTVYFGGQARSTAYVSSAQLNAGILASDINNDGPAIVFVFNPLPGGGPSNSIAFPVSALAPIVSTLKPSTTMAGGPLFDLDVLGSNFVTDSAVYFNGTAVTVLYDSPIALTAIIPAADIMTQGTATISVTTPANGISGSGGTSNTVTLTISPPEVHPAVTSISPTSAAGGGPAFTLTVNGSGFVQSSQVTFNQANVPTTLVSSSQLTAAIPASAIAVAGYANVAVINPGNLVSVSQLFTITNPPPQGSSVAPPTLPAGSNSLTLTVSGAEFVSGSVAQVNGASRVTNYVSPTSLQATLLPSDLMQGGTLDITVLNPPPGGGTTSAIPLGVANYSVTPATSPTPVTPGQTANFPLTLSPSNGAFSDPVVFSVSPLPAGAAASFAPSATITPGATPQTVTLSVATTPYTAASQILSPHGFGTAALPMYGMAFMVFALAGIWLRAFGGRARRLAPLLLLALLIVAAAGLAACGAVGSGAPTPAPIIPATGTPPGNYPITVTATSGGVSHSATVTLSVMQ